MGDTDGFQDGNLQNQSSESKHGNSFHLQSDIESLPVLNEVLKKIHTEGIVAFISLNIPMLTLMLSFNLNNAVSEISYYEILKILIVFSVGPRSLLFEILGK